MSRRIINHNVCALVIMSICILFLTRCKISEKVPIKEITISEILAKEQKYKYDLKAYDVCDFAIIDGHLVSDLDSIISLKSSSYLVPLNMDKFETWDNQCEVVFIIGIENTQSAKNKKEVLQRFKDSLNQKVIWTSHYLSDDAWKVISINGKTYFPKEISHFVNQLNVSDIEYIYDIELPLHTVLYGELAENGMIEIRLKDGIEPFRWEQEVEK